MSLSRELKSRETNEWLPICATLIASLKFCFVFFPMRQMIKNECKQITLFINRNYYLLSLTLHLSCNASHLLKVVKLNLINFVNKFRAMHFVLAHAVCIWRCLKFNKKFVSYAILNDKLFSLNYSENLQNLFSVE